MNAQDGESVASPIVGLFAIGMAVSFLAVEPYTPTSRARALFLGLLGATFLVNMVPRSPLPEVVPLRFFSIAETLILITISRKAVRKIAANTRR